jgi:hypothetical protein
VAPISISVPSGLSEAARKLSAKSCSLPSPKLPIWVTSALAGFTRQRKSSLLVKITPAESTARSSMKGAASPDVVRNMPICVTVFVYAENV